MQSQPDISKRSLFLLFLFSVVVWFGVLDYRKLAKPDEGRYAEISREMAVSGDWVTPRLNGIKYFEKPPMQYWATAAAFNIFGFHEWTARLWTALTGFLTVLLIWWQGKRLIGPQAGFYSALVLISNFYFIALGHINTLDMGLTFFTTLSLVGFISAQHERFSVSERKRWMLTSWTAIGLAALSKGLIGIVFPGATLFLYAIFTQNWTIWRDIYLARGLLIFFAITAPWFMAVSLKNPEFPWFFFIHEHFLRFATSQARREESGIYFLKLLFLLMLPWTLVMIGSVWTSLRESIQSHRKENKQIRILLIWSIFILLFFSISRSKLPAYILPIFPSLALLMGKHIDEMSTRQLKARILPLLLAAGLFLLVIVYVLVTVPPFDNIKDFLQKAANRDYIVWIIAAMSVLTAGIAYACLQLLKDKKTVAVITIAVTGFLSGHIILTGYEELSPTQSSYSLAEKIRPFVKKDIPFYSVKTYDQTLPFYLQRTFTLVDFKDELAYGLEQEPHLSPSIEEFKLRWNDKKDALAIMKMETYRELIGPNFPMEIIAQEERVDDRNRRVVVKNIGERTCLPSAASSSC